MWVVVILCSNLNAVKYAVIQYGDHFHFPLQIQTAASYEIFLLLCVLVFGFRRFLFLDSSYIFNYTPFSNARMSLQDVCFKH